MIKINILILCIGILTFTSSLGYALPSSKKACKTLTVSAHPEYPPMSWVNEKGNMNGVMVDLAMRIGKELGVKTKAVFAGPWKRVLTKLESGEIDVVTTIYRVPERVKIYDFTIPITPDPIAIFTVKGKEIYLSEWKDLIKYQGVSTRGDSWGAELDQYIEKNLNVHIVNTFEQMFRTIMSGRADYGIQGYYPILLNGKQQNFIDLVSIDRNWLKSEMVYFAFSKKSPCRHLIKDYNALIKKHQKNKLIERLMDHYLNCRISSSIECNHY